MCYSRLSFFSLFLGKFLASGECSDVKIRVQNEESTASIGHIRRKLRTALVYAAATVAKDGLASVPSVKKVYYDGLSLLRAPGHRNTWTRNLSRISTIMEIDNLELKSARTTILCIACILHEIQAITS
jgi:hypothetical protein